MHCGTSVDTFLRENLDWLGRATNWAKFSATAGLGVTHKGNLRQSRTLMVWGGKGVLKSIMMHEWEGEG